MAQRAPYTIFYRVIPAIALLFVLFSFSAVQAHHILFYYNSANGTNGAFLQCVNILRNAGNRVTVIDVAGENRDPTQDNWGPPYDQVWDLRLEDNNGKTCGSGSPSSPDYFDARWRNKAIFFLNHCGKLFLVGENYELTDREEGLYQFLQAVQGVKKGYDLCPPSLQGNSSTGGAAVYPVKNGLGPVSFYGAWVGGIPRAFLTGTNFVDTQKDWKGNDHVDRSIVSGWEGSQLGGQVNAPLCARGKLFIVWDATMWELWEPVLLNEVKSSIWDEASWPPGNQKVTDVDPKATQYRKKITRKFFSAVEKWLGGRDCPCTNPVTVASLPSNRPRVTPVASRVVTIARKAFTPSTVIPVKKPTPQSARQGLIVPSGPNGSAPQTIVFATLPVNVYMTFRDGPGEYKLEVVNAEGKHLRTMFDRRIIAEKDAWAAWDGIDEEGKLMSVGLYYAVFIKDGRLLKKIVLSWVPGKS